MARRVMCVWHFSAAPLGRAEGWSPALVGRANTQASECSLLCVHRVLGQPAELHFREQRQQCHQLVTVNSITVLKALFQYLRSQKGQVTFMILT